MPLCVITCCVEQMPPWVFCRALLRTATESHKDDTGWWGDTHSSALSWLYELQTPTPPLPPHTHTPLSHHQCPVWHEVVAQWHDCALLLWWGHQALWSHASFHNFSFCVMSRLLMPWFTRPPHHCINPQDCVGIECCTEAQPWPPETGQEAKWGLQDETLQKSILKAFLCCGFFEISLNIPTTFFIQ